jgi:hypothetical protein
MMTLNLDFSKVDMQKLQAAAARTQDWLADSLEALSEEEFEQLMLETDNDATFS